MQALTYWPLALILLGLGLLGAKKVEAFVVWGCIAMLSSGLTLYTFRSSRNLWPVCWVLLIAVVAVSQIFSTSPSTSLYFTLQALVFLVTWMALRAQIQDWTRFELHWDVLQWAGTATMVLTLLQMLLQKLPNGFLPINPTFNAAWMASLTVLFAIRAFGTRNFSSLEWKWDAGLALGLGLLVIAGPSRSALVALAVGLLYRLFGLMSKKKLVRLLRLRFLFTLCFPYFTL